MFLLRELKLFFYQKLPDLGRSLFFFGGSQALKFCPSSRSNV